MTLYKVKEHDDLLKDSKTGAVLLANHAKANEYNMKKQAIADSKRMSSEINTIKEKLGEIEEIKTELTEIKTLLLQIATNGNK